MVHIQEKKLGSAWLAITQDDAKRMIKLLDADSDGKVSLDECVLQDCCSCLVTRPGSLHTVCCCRFRKFAYLLPEAQVCSA